MQKQNLNNLIFYLKTIEVSIENLKEFKECLKIPLHFVLMQSSCIVNACYIKNV